MLKVNELFAGIGAFREALIRIGIPHEVVGISEIDKYAIKSYEAIYGKTKNYGNISKVDKLDYADLWTYGFPCQDISVAGKQAGIEKGKTRSGLLYEVERLLEKSKECGELPKYLMLENVKNLVGKKFKPQFEEWLQKLDELGYNSYWQVLNAKNYGIPQNRERVFAISIRKDIDTGYEFPIGFDNGKRLKDILETEVDEKFYLSSNKVNLFMKQGNVNPSGNGMNGNVCTSDICNTLTTNKGEGPKYADDGVSPTLNTMQGGNRQPKVLIPQATKQGYIECNILGVADLSFPDSKTRRGRVQENGEICPTLTAGTQDLCYIDTPCIAASRGRNPQNPSDRTIGSPTEQRLEINKNGTSNTITTVQKDNYVVEPMIIDPQGRLNKQCTPRNFCPTLRAQTHGNLSQVTYPNTDFRIRKLTPLECWRLMGFTDDQFRKAAKVNSNSQLYKQAGNSIVVNVLEAILGNLLVEERSDWLDTLLD